MPTVVHLHPQYLAVNLGACCASSLLLSLAIKVINGTGPFHSLHPERYRKCEYSYFMNMQLDWHLYNVGCEISWFAEPQQYTVLDIHVPIVSAA